MGARATHHRIVIIGSGFAGIGTAIRLLQEGERDFVVLERASDVGGVWRDNTYPGCACDVQSHLYELSFAPNPSWSRAYSPQAEIQDYLRGCATRFGVMPHVRFSREVTGARWEAASARWIVETSEETFTASFLVLAAGALADPAIPSIEGLERFAGPAFHSARWRHDVDLEGKRVAVIGTGASAIQFVPAIQPRVAELRVFQRTAPWILPRKNPTVPPWARRVLQRVPGAHRLVHHAIRLGREAFLVSFHSEAAARFAERRALRYLERTIADPVLCAKLTPRYRIGCKRILLTDEYLPALARPNVEVVTEGIREITERGIVTSDGAEHEADVIVFGTGFRVTDQPVAHLVRGRLGRTLAETWKGSPRAHLGTSVSGFPNLFLLLGPNTGLGHSSVVLMIEAQIEHVLKALSHLERRGASTIEPRIEAEDAFVARVDRDMEGTTWVAGGCASWYLDETGRNSTLWPGTTIAFRRLLDRFDPSDYLIEGAPSRAPSLRPVPAPAAP